MILALRNSAYGRGAKRLALTGFATKKLETGETRNSWLRALTETLVPSLFGGALGIFILAVVGVLGNLGSAAAATLPGGFVESSFANGLASPTAMEFAPDGRLFVCQQGGQLRVIKNELLLATPFLTVTVDSLGERGLLGVAFDPNFAANHFVYIYHTATTPTAHNRVSRFTADGDVAVAGSEVVILDLNDLGGASNHNGGAIHFGTDGKLYVAVGENSDSAHSQTLTNLLGKLLRINPDGTIPTDNPFYDSTAGVNRAIWALGLRNPFSFAVQPGSGRIFINDVGENTWEEINEAVAGANYGWPNCEGDCSPANSSYLDPLFRYGHGSSATTGDSIAGGVFYNPATVQFPGTYVGKYFFADYTSGWIRQLDPANGNQVSGFATGINSPIDLKVGADGRLYYLTFGSGEVYAVGYTGSGVPQITQQPADQTVQAGQSATFIVNSTGALGHQWQRDGESLPGATAASYTVTSTSVADDGVAFRCVLTNVYGATTSNPAYLHVSNNNSPTGTITSPLAGTLYAAGDTIQFAGTASDPEDGLLPASAFSWTIVFHHDTHTHPFLGPINAVTNGTFVIPTQGHTEANVWYRIHLTVTDSGGRTQTRFMDVSPRTATVSLTTSPPGLQLTLDGQPVTSPVSVTSVVGVNRTLGAISPQTFGGTTYEFVSWSDGGAATHAISLPPKDITCTATLRVATPPNSPPSITDMAYQTIDMDQSTGPLSFTIADVDTPLDSLTLSTNSSNPTLVPLGNIVLEGSGTNRTMTVTPATGQTGTATITLSVSDGQHVVSAKFVLTVMPVGVPPSMTGIPNQTINSGASTGPLSFTIGDADTPVGSLTFSTNSSNLTLVPLGNIVLGGNGTNRTVMVTPAAGQSGTATITLGVSDGQFSTSTSFLVTVNPLFAGTKTFTNALAITILDSAAGTPYPSTINVTAMGGTITNVTVTLMGFAHTWPDDVDILLVSPTGQKVMILSDAAGGNAINNLTVTLSDAAASAPPDNGSLVSGTFRPSNYEPTDPFAPPAPAGPFATALSNFNGRTANGEWSLYVMDDGSGDQGAIAGGWSLAITTVGAGVADAVAPTVALTAPTNNATVSGNAILVSADAADNVGVVGVQFQLDGVPLGAEDISFPYTLSWNSTTVADGVHALTALVRDAANNQMTSSVVNVAVSNPPDLTPPSTPTGLNATAVSAWQINLSWTDSTDNGVVAGYRVYRNGNLVATVTATAHADTGLLPATTNSYELVALDAAGNTSAPSPAVSAATPAAPDGVATGPLVPLAANPRYFTDGSGKAIYLTGSHTWGNNRDYGVTDPPPPFDFTLYLNFLQSHNHNFFRLWTWEMPHSEQGALHIMWWRLPFPWPRTGPGVANDGKAKFDLAQFNQPYFDRLRARVTEARNRGMYVAIMLWDGYGLQTNPHSTDGFPFTAGNNINGISSDGIASQSLVNAAVTAVQEAYARKVIDTVNDLDNVLYEIVNEAGGYSTAWQYHMINFIKQYEAGKPKQHPVGMTYQYTGGSDTTLYNSPADWISTSEQYPVSDGTKVIINDTDHSYYYTGLVRDGPAAQQTWVWKNFLSGNNTLFMDPYLVVWEGRNAPNGTTPDPYWEVLRNSLGYTRLYAEKMNLAAMTPRPTLASSGACLANPGSEYLVYSGGGGFTLTVVAGTYRYEWFNPTAGTIAAAGTLTLATGNQSFTAPFGGDAVLYLKSPAAPLTYQKMILSKVPGGTIQLQLIGDIGFNYFIESSTNHNTWSIWTNFIGLNTTNILNDLESQNYQRRFFRVVQ